MSKTSTIAFTSDAPAKTIALGSAMARIVRAGDVIALVGELGAGKTQFVRGFADGLGMNARAVASPTFVLMVEHETDDPNRALVHIDAYRMDTLSDLESIGWSPELFDTAVTLVEWADRIEQQLPVDHLRIEIEHTGETTRTISISGSGAWADRFDDVRAAVEPLCQTTPCPTCKTPVTIAAATYPFCGERCKMADLNKWFSGAYMVSRPLKAEDDELDV